MLADNLKVHEIHVRVATEMPVHKVQEVAWSALLNFHWERSNLCTTLLATFRMKTV